MNTYNNISEEEIKRAVIYVCEMLIPRKHNRKMRDFVLDRIDQTIDRTNLTLLDIAYHYFKTFGLFCSETDTGDQHLKDVLYNIMKNCPMFGAIISDKTKSSLIAILNNWDYVYTNYLTDTFFTDIKEFEKLKSVETAPYTTVTKKNYSHVIFYWNRYDFITLKLNASNSITINNYGVSDRMLYNLRMCGYNIIPTMALGFKVEKIK